MSILPIALPRPLLPAWRILCEAVGGTNRHNISLIASGVAFYGMLAIFPALAALVSLYGLLADPITVSKEIAGVESVLPHEATVLLDQQLQSLVAAPRGHLSLGFAVSVLLALWSARSGAGAMMTALNIATEAEERRGIVVQYLLALAITLGGVLFGIVAMALIAAVPVAIAVLPLDQTLAGAAALLRWPLLAGLWMAALAALYRFGPSRQETGQRIVTIGAVAATALWLAGSGLFSLYVTAFANYDKTYGSLGAAVVLLMWFYLTAFAVLFGAEIDAATERGAERRQR